MIFIIFSFLLQIKLCKIALGINEHRQDLIMQEDHAVFSVITWQMNKFI